MKHHLSTLRGLALGLALVLGGALSRVDAGDPTRVGIETVAGLGREPATPSTVSPPEPTPPWKQKTEQTRERAPAR